MSNPGIKKEDYSDPKYQGKQPWYKDPNNNQYQYKGLQRVDKLANVGYVIGRGFVYGWILKKVSGWGFNMVANSFTTTGKFFEWIGRKLKK